MDASPWGIGGVLYRDGQPFRWFASPLHPHDLQLFQACVGDSAFTTLWELLAVVVGLKVWRAGQVGVAVQLRSDSLSALQAIAKNSAKHNGLSLLLQELSLEQAEFSFTFDELIHIPGVSNVLPDALSRLWAPGEAQKQFPESLLSVQETSVPNRDRCFWRILEEKVRCPALEITFTQRGRDSHKCSPRPSGALPRIGSHAASTSSPLQGTGAPDSGRQGRGAQSIGSEV